jgi:hypothetical protein
MEKEFVKVLIHRGRRKYSGGGLQRGGKGGAPPFPFPKGGGDSVMGNTKRILASQRYSQIRLAQTKTG